MCDYVLCWFVVCLSLIASSFLPSLFLCTCVIMHIYTALPYRMTELSNVFFCLQKRRGHGEHKGGLTGLFISEPLPLPLLPTSPCYTVLSPPSPLLPPPPPPPPPPLTQAHWTTCGMPSLPPTASSSRLLPPTSAMWYPWQPPTRRL